MMVIPTIVVLFEILVKYRILLDDVLRRRRPYRSAMCIEQLALEVALPEICFRKLVVGQYGTGIRAENDRHYLVWYVIAVCFRHHWKLFKDVVYKLRCDDDLDLSALYRLWAGIHELTWTATLLVFCRCLCKQEVLHTSTAG